MQWKNKFEIYNYKYKCGHCNCIVGTNNGYATTNSYLQSNPIQKIYIYVQIVKSQLILI